MISLDDAIETLYRTVLDRREDTAPEDTPAITSTTEKPWGWVFYYNNAHFAATGDIAHMWVGPGPIFFNRTTGEIRQFGSGCEFDRELADYESELAASGGQWCLWLTDQQTRAQAVARIKNALAINTSVAAEWITDLPCCLFSGHQRHLTWMADKLAEYSIDANVDLQMGPDPAVRPFILPEQMLNPTAAQAFHEKWDVRGY